MNKINFLLFLFLFSTSIIAQEYYKTAVITLETKRNYGFHKHRTDHFIVLINAYENLEEEYIFPVYSSIVTEKNHYECCVEKKLKLGYLNKDENFHYPYDYLESEKKFYNILKEKRRKIKTVRKKWKMGNKETINVYLTPVNGNFCFCFVKVGHKETKNNYNGQIAIPVSNISYDPDFWNTEISKWIPQYDFTKVLPFNINNPMGVIIW